MLGARDPSRSDCPVSDDDAVQVAEHARHAHGADTVAIRAVACVRLLLEVDRFIEIHRKVGRKSQALEGGAVQPKGHCILEQATGGGYIPFLSAARPSAIKSFTVAVTLMIIPRLADVTESPRWATRSEDSGRY